MCYNIIISNYQTEREVISMIHALPNIITASRIIGTAIMAFTKPFSLAFYLIYTFCGLSDIVDGYLARKYKLSSKLGAKLDSIADLLFYSVMLLRIFPVLADVLPLWIWVAVGTILIMRVISYAVAAIKYRKFAALHTYLNKATGVAVFLVPYLIKTPAAVGFCAFVCLIAICASAQELYTHLHSERYAGN